MRDMLAAERRALPWLKVEKDYVFDAPEGSVRLADLFGPNSQLLVQHFMWRWDLDQGCPSCSLMADHLEGALVHLENHDVSVVRISRGPLDKLMAYSRRLGWTARTVSSFGSDFNFDFGVSFTDEQMAGGRIVYNYGETAPYPNMNELPGMSVFFKNAAGDVFLTYSSYARGVERVVGAFDLFDMTPRGRNETRIMDWVRRNDEYERPKGAAPAKGCCAAE
jgi:predicted dithiol-disulfide oxidoreductase (DUF899 family)